MYEFYEYVRDYPYKKFFIQKTKEFFKPIVVIYNKIIKEIKMEKFIEGFKFTFVILGMTFLALAVFALVVCSFGITYSMLIKLGVAKIVSLFVATIVSSFIVAVIVGISNAI
jgi:hypothetical protein